MKGLGLLMVFAASFLAAAFLTPDSSAFLTSQLVLNYTFEDGSGTSVNDQTAYNNDGYFSSTKPPAFFALPKNGAYSLKCVEEDYMSALNSVSLNVTGNFTFSIWFNSSITNDYQYLVDKATGSAVGNVQLRLYLSNTNAPVCALTTTSGYKTATGSAFASANTWYHVACMYNTSHINVYKNGVLAAQTATGTANGTSGSNITLCDPDPLVGITTQALTGYIDDFHYWNTSLNSSEINLDYLNTLVAEDAGGGGTADTTAPEVTLVNPESGSSTSQTGVYTYTLFNCSATDDINLANVTLWGNWSGGWHANNTASKSGAYNFSTWSIGLPVGTYIYNCRAGDNSSNYAFAAANYTFTIKSVAYSTASMVTNYTFEDGSGGEITDWTGYNNNGFFNNTYPPTFSTNAKHGAYSLKCIENDSVTTADSISLNVTGSFTFSIWFNTSVTNDYQYLVDKTTGPNASNVQLRLYLNNTNAPVCAVSTTTGYKIIAGNNVAANVWSHASCMYNGSHINIYQNGILINQTSTGTANGTAGSNITLCELDDEVGITTQGLTGYIDDFHYWNTSLTDSQIYNDYYGNLTEGDLSSDTTAPTVTLVAPSNANVTSQTGAQTTQAFNCTATDSINLSNSTLYGNWSGGWHINETLGMSGTYAQAIYTKTLAAGTYLWNCYVCDNSSNCAFAAANYTFTVKDITAPVFRWQSQNATTITDLQQILLSAQGLDGILLHSAILSTNTSGSSELEYPNTTWAKSNCNPLFSGYASSGIEVAVPEWKYKDGVYHMVYVDNQVAPHSFELFYANSTDACHWNLQGKILAKSGGSNWDADGTSAASIIFYNDTSMWMYYTGVSTSNTYCNGLAITYYDRQNYWMNWTRWTGNLCGNAGDGCLFCGTEAWEHAGAVSGVDYMGVFMVSPSEFQMVYQGQASLYTGKLGYANSTDGLNWNKYSGNPVMEAEGEGLYLTNPFVINASATKYYVFYSQNNGTSTWHSNWISWTTDFINYYDRTKILYPTPTAYDNVKVCGPSVLVNDTDWMMIYEAANETTAHSIALATLPLSSTGSGWDNTSLYLNTANVWTYSNFTFLGSSVTAPATVGWKIYYNDSSGNSNVTGEMAFDVTAGDTTPPSISWNTPATNSTVTQNQTWAYFNATISETGGSAILNINGTINYTMSWSSNYSYYNLTGLENSTVCGRVYANDTSGNLNWSTAMCVNINLTSTTPDTTPPSISWNTPSNLSYTQNQSWITWNATLTETTGQAIININNTNYTMTITGSFAWYNSTGLSNLTELCSRIYANDTSGNLNLSDMRCATINLTSTSDMTPPTVTITSPTATDYMTTSIWLNYTIGEVPNAAWYKLNGGSNTSLISYCYQETANISTSCGGLSTGTYTISGVWNNSINLYDGSWSTYSQDNNLGDGVGSNFYINYSKPTGIANNSFWEVKWLDNSGNPHITNFTITSSCLNYYTDVISLRIQSYGPDANPNNWYNYEYCYDGSWTTLGSAGGLPIYEEAMFWDIAGNHDNITITASQGSNTVIVYANDSAGNIGSDSVTFNVDSIHPSPQFVSPTLSNNSFTSNVTWIYVNVSAGEALNSCTLDWNGANQTMTTVGSSCYRNMTGLTNGTAYYFRVYANDTVGNMNVTEWRQITVRLLDFVTSYVQTQTADVIEQTSHAFTLNFTTTETATVLASLVYDGTTYSASRTVLDANSTYFTASVTSPAVSSTSENKDWHWAVTINGAGLDTSTEQQAVYKMILTNCSAGSESTTKALWYYLKDEESGSPITGTFAVTYDISTGGSFERAYPFNFTGQNNYSVCIYPAWASYYADAIGAYNSSGYLQRSYYLTNHPLSNSTETVNLLLSSVSSTLVTITVVDTVANPQEGIDIIVQRYYPDTGIYEQVYSLRTGADGKTIAYMIPYDVWYKFILSKDGTILRTVSPMVITSSTLTLTIDYPTYGNPYEYRGGVASSCAWNSTTSVLSCTVVDTTGKMTNACLNVSKYGAVGMEDEFEVCSDTSSSTLIWTGGNASQFMYPYEVKAYFSDTNILVDNGVIGSKHELYDTMGDYAIIIALIIIFVVAFLSITANPAIPIVMSCVAMIAGFALGVLPIGLSGLASIIVAGAVIILKMRT